MFIRIDIFSALICRIQHLHLSLQTEKVGETLIQLAILALSDKKQTASVYPLKKQF